MPTARCGSWPTTLRWRAIPPCVSTIRRPAIRSTPTSTRAATTGRRGRAASRRRSNGCTARGAAHRAVRPGRRRHARGPGRSPGRAGRRFDIAGLLLFEPAIVGRSYIRQMILEADLQSGQSMPRELGLEIRENKFGPKSVEQIGAFDLRKLELRAGMKVAIFARPENKAVDDCVKAWVARGVEASRHGFDGLHVLLHYDTLAEQDLGDFAQADRLARPGGAAGDALGHAGQPAGGGAAAAGLHRHAVEIRPGKPAFWHALPARARQHRGDGADPERRPRAELRRGAAERRAGAQAGADRHRLVPLRLRRARRQPRPAGQRAHRSAMPSPTASPTCARRSTPWRRWASAASRSTASASARSTRLHAAAVDPRLSSLVLINLPLFTVPTANVLGQLEQRGRSAGEYLGKLARLGSWSQPSARPHEPRRPDAGGDVPPADEHDRPADAHSRGVSA